MKNLFKNLMLVAVAAMAFVGCEQDIEVNATTEKTAVRVIAGLDETRSGFGDKINGAYDQVWNGGEVLSYHHFNYEQYTSDNSNVTLPEGESKKAEFNIELKGVGNALYSTGVIRIASPASSATAVQGGFTIKVPTEQTPLANSVDPAAHILTSVVEYHDGVPSTIEAQFEHAVAYGKMTLNNLPEGNYDYVTISLDNRTYKLYTTNVQNNVFWFGCEAVKPAEVKVSVVNETENVAYTKTLDLTKATNFEFVTGRLGSFSVEMEGVEPTTPEVADTFNPDVYLNAPVIDSNNGTCFKFTFKDNSSNYYRVWLAEENRANDMMAVGNYKGNGNGSSDNYTPDASHFAATMYDNWGRVSGSYARHHTEDSTLDVTYADGAYTIIITNKSGVTYGYKGMPDGWVAPSGSEGGEEPEQPVEPEQPTIKETYNVTWEYYQDFSTSGTFGHAWKVNSNDGGFSAKITTDSRNNYTTATSFTPGTYNYHPQYADGDYADGMWFTMAADSIIIEGTTYGASQFDGEMTVVANNGAYDITVDLYSATDSTKITTLVGTFGASTGGDTEPTALATPELTVSASGNTVNASWGAVDGAANYTVTLNGENKGTITETSISFSDLAYSADYTVTVVANPADSTTNTVSEAASITVKTEANPNAGSSDESVLVSCKYNGMYEGLLNHFQLKSSSGNTVINLLFGSNYTNSTMIFAQTYNSDNAINTYKSDLNGAGNLVCVNGIDHTIDGVSVKGNQSGSTVNVSKSGSTYTINITLSLSNGETKEYTFVGALS